MEYLSKCEAALSDCHPGASSWPGGEGPSSPASTDTTGRSVCGPPGTGWPAGRLPQTPGRGEAPLLKISKRHVPVLQTSPWMLAVTSWPPSTPCLQLLKVLSVHLGAQGQPRPVLPGPRPCAERGQPQYVAARGPGARMSHCHDGYWMST